MEKMMKIGGVTANRLIEKWGSPLYVYDEAKIEQKLEEYTQNFQSDHFACEVIYASKAFTCTAMLNKLKAYDCCLDVVSGGELYVAKCANFDPDKIYFHGNNKTDEELAMALEYNVKTIVIDNMHEVDKIITLASQYKKAVKVLIRINPKVEAHTHEFIMTATSDSKFGISIELVDEIVTMIQKIEASEFVVFDGFHSHIGSQIFERQAFVGAIEKMVAFIANMNTNIQSKVSTLNIGGGFGVVYTQEDKPTPTPLMCETLIKAIEEQCVKYQVTLQKVCMEPGRSIVAEAGYTLYRVGFTKQTQNKQFAFIDGGMADNIRPALYDAAYACDVANKMNEEKKEVYEIAGKCCESGDIIIHHAKLPKIETGDIIVVYSTGAYGYTMASNYNRLNKLAVVFVKDGNDRLVIRRETYEDQMRLDVREDER
ncbi:MAG: diaminopimelate decarboxylase [Erysipelotrichia bacterium]|nr:diaminopimelate decarboxylase [Erysipelotrichia bacterium]NCC55229.1 diaminopimelate decarboxylase [Erysipelotrichia bacterium]